MKRFTVTEDHLKLLRSANVGWDGCEFGAPAIDCKRPYGNSDVYKDMGRILGIERRGNPLTEHDFTASQYARMAKAHHETQIALQIILAAGSFVAGEYEAMDVCVTVPKNFKHESSPGKVGLAAWLAEGDAPGMPWSGQEWWFTTHGRIPKIEPGERVYVVCDGRLVGYAPLVNVMIRGSPKKYRGPIAFVRHGGAVACTIDEPITGFRGWRYRWWDREQEKPLEL